MSDLFQSPPKHQPLAARMRPETLAHYVGQTHLLGQGKPLREAVERGQLHSMVLWGPPGVAKPPLRGCSPRSAMSVSPHFPRYLPG
jgi:putative ATPase